MFDGVVWACGARSRAGPAALLTWPQSLMSTEIPNPEEPKPPNQKFPGSSNPIGQVYAKTVASQAVEKINETSEQ